MEKTEISVVCDVFRNAKVGEKIDFDINGDGKSARLTVVQVCRYAAVTGNYLCAGCYMDSFFGDGDCPYHEACNSGSRPDGKDVVFMDDNTVAEIAEKGEIIDVCGNESLRDEYDRLFNAEEPDKPAVYDEEGDVNVGGDIEKLTVADLKMAKGLLEEDLTDIISKFEEKTGVEVRGIGFDDDMGVHVELDI